MLNLKKIILVEDDQYDAMMSLDTFKELPIINPVLHLESGDELLDYIKENGTGDIALVILDLNMPKVSGLEALKVIRGKYPPFPVLILTSSAHNPDIEAAYLLGANSFITKPVKTEEFQKVVSRIGLYWAIHNQAL